MRMAVTTMAVEEIEDLKGDVLEDVIEAFYDEVDGVCEYIEMHEDFVRLSDNANAQTFLTLAREELTHAETMHKVLDSLVTPEHKRAMLDNPFTLLHQKHIEKLSKMKDKISTMR